MRFPCIVYSKNFVNFSDYVVRLSFAGTSELALWFERKTIFSNQILRFHYKTGEKLIYEKVRKIWIRTVFN